MPRTEPLYETSDGERVPLVHARPRVDHLGRYQLDECIGAGGMGEVFRGFDPELDRAVAIKRLVAFGTDDDARIRLQREAQAIARLSHPHVVQVFDVGRDIETGDLFIAMELVDGVTLRQWSRQTARSWREIAEVFRQAGEGLHAAHQQGIVHRDFKPENVLITRDGIAKVVDFGLAKPAGEHADDAIDEDVARANAKTPAPRESEVDPFQPTPRRTTSRSRSDAPNVAFDSDITPAGARLGTPAYMPPEQGAGLPSTPRADQFSFAVALFEALAGYLPFPGESPAEYSVAVLEGQVLEFPRGTAVPRRLQEAIYRGLETEPRARFVSLRPLLDELGRDPLARRRRVLALGGAVIVGGVAAFGVSAMTPPPADETRSRCETDAAIIDAVWDETVRTATLAAIARVDAPFAADTAARTGKALDRLGEGWRAARVRWCSGRIDELAATAAVSEAIGVCLDRVLTRERELVASLRDPDADTAAHAIDAIERLDRELVRCDEPAFLAQLVADGTADEDEQRARELIDHARQRLELGQAKEGLRVLEQVDDAAAHRAVIALERGLVHSGLEKRRGNLTVARALLEEAARAGLGSEAPLLAAEWHASYGDLCYALGELDAMAEPYERAFALRRRHLGPDDSDTLVMQAARGHVPYARGDYAAALTIYRDAAERAAASVNELDPGRIMIDEW
ncbi:MAG TPA: protein kinase, partial [Nannocystaceae bacterium]|nr:protein kinase [Nannocystaceae bacterium]